MAGGGDLVRALLRRADEVLPSTAYRGGHTAPVDPEYHSPLHDLTETGTYPGDVYSPNGPRYYGHGGPEDAEAFEVINRVAGDPDAPVTIYRAVPEDAPDEILPGDWVTTSETYAHGHGDMRGDYKVLTGETEAKRLRTDGNSPMEYGYTGAIAALAAALAAQSEDADAGVIGKTAKSVDDLAAKMLDDYPLDVLSLYNKGDDLKLDTLVVSKDSRKQGVGSDVMDDINDYADKEGLRVVLSPAQKDDFHGTTSRGRLVNFYKRHGFKENKGRNKDFEISEGMYRNPAERGAIDPRLLGTMGGASALAAALIAKGGEMPEQIRRPEHERLAAALMQARKVGRSLEGSPAELLWPEGTINWLDRLAYGDEPTIGERANVLLDWL